MICYCGTLPDEAATEQLGASLGQVLNGGAVFFLLGQLGAGKTTLVRGLMHGLGHSGAVKSPTYTLVESYELVGRVFYHFDLYRLGDPEELEYMGGRDYFADPQAVSLIEWPQRGGYMLPAPDVVIELEYSGSGRRMRMLPRTPTGEGICQRLLDVTPLLFKLDENEQDLADS